MTLADFSLLSSAELASVLEHDPLRADLHQLMFARRHAEGDELAALAHLIAARAIEADDQASVRNLYMVATGYFMKGDYAIASNWYALVLRLNPDMAEVYQNLVVIHLHFGRTAEAELCRTRAYELLRIYIDPILHPQRRLLILCVGRTSGNIPYEVLLSGETSERIRYVIDYADESEDLAVPQVDLIFNAIGEPDVAAPLYARLCRFLQRRGQAVINHPEAIARTRRHELPALMAGLTHVVTAPCCRIEAGDPNDMALTFSFPVLLRPLESHGGEGLGLCDTAPQLQAQRDLAQAYYVSRFIDFKSADGYYRKYRIIYVDRQPYPYHLAIGTHWMVHYYSTDMLEQPWKIAEERRFMEDPANVLGPALMQALLEIGQRLDLDYGGIDFTVLPSGELLIFEANATMLVHKVSQDGVLAHKNSHIQKIADAFETLQCKLSKASNPG